MPWSHFSRCSADKGSHGVNLGRILLWTQEGHCFVLLVRWAFRTLQLWRLAQTRWPTCLFFCKGAGEDQVRRHLLQTPGPLDWSTGWVSRRWVKTDAHRWCRWKQHCSKSHTEIRAYELLVNGHILLGETVLFLESFRGSETCIYSFWLLHSSLMKWSVLFKPSFSSLNK